MRKYNWILMAVAIFALVSFTQATETRALGVEEAAAMGATHVIMIDYDDFTETTANTAQTLTVGIDAKQSCEMIAFVLVAAFDETTTNTTLTVKVGDGGDDDYLLASTQIATDGTEIWLKFAPSNGGAVVITPQTIDIWHSADGSGATNRTETTVSTNVTAVFTAATLGEKVYTADDTLDFVFTPSSTTAALNDFTVGEMRVYLRIYDAR